MTTLTTSLADLRYHWGAAYEITQAGGTFRACRRDDGTALTADAALRLSAKIRADYLARPVPRRTHPDHPLPGGKLAALAGDFAAWQIDRFCARAARPIVKAVGIFRVRFHATDGVKVQLTEVYIDGGELKEGRSWVKTGAFDQQHVDAGEELPTTVVFPPINPPGSVIGWLVYLKIAAPTRLIKFRSAWWMDQVFVPRLNAAEGSLMRDGRPHDRARNAGAASARESGLRRAGRQSGNGGPAAQA